MVKRNRFQEFQERNKSLEKADVIAKRFGESKKKKEVEEKYETYNESLKEYLPEWQKPFVNSWEFIHLCMAFEKLTREYSQENQHNLSVQKHAFEFYCKQKIEETKND